MDDLKLETKCLIGNSTTHFDVYVKPSPASDNDDFVLYAKAPYFWTDNEIARLISAGFNSTFVDLKDEENLNIYKKASFLMSIKNLSPTINSIKKENLNAILDLAYTLISGLFLFPLNENVLKALETIAECLASHIVSGKPLLGVWHHPEHKESYLIRKSLNLSVTLMSMAYKFGHKEPSLLKQYFLGGVLHDIGKKNLPHCILAKPGPLNQDEWATIFKHTALGLEIIKPFHMSEIVYNIIELHHEKPDGSGYPYGLSESAIPLWVQWASVAEIFNALTSERCYFKKMNRYEALVFMKQKMNTPLASDAFRLLVETLHG